MVRCLLIQLVTKELPNHQRIGAPRRDGAFAREVLQKTYHQHLEVNHRVDRRPASLLTAVERCTESMHLPSKLYFLQSLTELVVKSARLDSRQILAGDPELTLLNLSLWADHRFDQSYLRALSRRPFLLREVIISTGC